MLRSLVGSEMCIRDSQSTASTNMRKVAALIQAGTWGHVKDIHLWTDRASGWWKQGVPRPAPGKACLLYTSDAADDLLCVDLGGRRIITKKHQYRCSATACYKISTYSTHASA